MDLRSGDSQRMLAETARALLAKRVDQAQLDSDAAKPGGYDGELWSELVGLGWTGLLAGEQLGGVASDVLHLGTIVEELGRSALASPLRASAGAAGVLLAACGDSDAAEQLERRLVAGTTIAVAHASTTPGLVARATAASGGGLWLNAPLRVLEWAAQADALVVAAATSEDRFALVWVDPAQDGVAIEAAQSFDNERVALVALNDVHVEAARCLAVDIEPAQLHEALATVVALRAAEQLGGARAVLEMTVAYVKDRRQFGHPLGSLQAVQHRCSDMATDVDAIWLTTYEALWLASQGRSCLRAAAVASVTAARASERVLMAGSQLHGGVGFMMEFGLHWHYRRLKAQQLRLGTRRAHSGWASDQLLLPGRSLAPFPSVHREVADVG